ncbi:hypothetical protein [Aquimarina mytili]|uniref:STAS/SEC14 domain-containing protein n=1 Tax=Aquimarina mytili TaxID=874423 RepID=A0A936ZZW1_9FLAO|nr:hypothetical protein [Aquimarina mytili]MBL0684960.1 hypothetical protein [Aquimarina mytili]
MTPKTNRKPVKEYTLDIGVFYFYQNFVIGEIKEGLNLNFESGKELFNLTKTHYKNIIPFVYISNRVHSYSFIPTGHYKSSKLFPNLKGYAIVVYDNINLKIAELEQTFMSWPNQIFTNLDDAIDWAEELIERE